MYDISIKDVFENDICDYVFDSLEELSIGTEVLDDKKLFNVFNNNKNKLNKDYNKYHNMIKDLQNKTDDLINGKFGAKHKGVDLKKYNNFTSIYYIARMLKLTSIYKLDNVIEKGFKTPIFDNIKPFEKLLYVNNVKDIKNILDIPKSDFSYSEKYKIDNKILETKLQKRLGNGYKDFIKDYGFTTYAGYSKKGEWFIVSVSASKTKIIPKLMVTMLPYKKPLTDIKLDEFVFLKNIKTILDILNKINIIEQYEKEWQHIDKLEKQSKLNEVKLYFKEVKYVLSLLTFERQSAWRAMVSLCRVMLKDIEKEIKG